MRKGIFFLFLMALGFSWTSLALASPKDLYEDQVLYECKTEKQIRDWANQKFKICKFEEFDPTGIKILVVIGTDHTGGIPFSKIYVYEVQGYGCFLLASRYGQVEPKCVNDGKAKQLVIISGELKKKILVLPYEALDANPDGFAGP